MGNSTDVSTGLLEAEELPALAQLHLLCFGARGDVLSLLRQRYGEGPGPSSEVVVARDSSGLLVGAQAVTWLPALLKGESVVVGMMTLGMVHPEFRRRGLFRRLVADAERVAWEGGASLLFTMPNDRSEPAFDRFETWLSGGRRSAHLLALDPGKLVGDRVGLGGLGSALGSPLRMAARWSRPSGDGLRELGQLDRDADAIDALAERVARQSGSLMLLRDSSFARWRYLDNPIADYRFHVSEGSGGQLDGLAVTTTQPRFGTTFGFVVDILADGPAARRKQLLRLAARSLWEQGASAAVCVGRMPGHRSVLRRAGFIDVTAVYPRTFHTYYSLPVDGDSAGSGFDPEEGWFLSLADFDSV